VVSVTDPYGRKWLRHYAANRKVAGSIPDEVIFLNVLYPSGRLGPGVYSATNRNEHQKLKNNNVSGQPTASVV
jgi:hypothetical protein